MSGYETIVTGLAVLPAGATDIGGDCVTMVEATDTGGGAFVRVRQGGSCSHSGRLGVAIDTQNWEAIKRAVDTLIEMCAAKNKQEGSAINEQRTGSRTSGD